VNAKTSAPQVDRQGSEWLGLFHGAERRIIEKRRTRCLLDERISDDVSIASNLEEDDSGQPGIRAFRNYPLGKDLSLELTQVRGEWEVGRDRR
jgi:hypothetical protein